MMLDNVSIASAAREAIVTILLHLRLATHVQSKTLDVAKPTKATGGRWQRRVFLSSKTARTRFREWHADC